MTRHRNRKHRIAITSVVLWLFHASLLNAQFSQFNNAETKVDSSQVEATLEALVNSTASLRAQLNSATQPSDDEAMPQLLPAKPLESVAEDAVLPQEIDEIRKRIKLLKQLRTRSDMKTASKPSGSSPSSLHEKSLHAGAEQAPPPSNLPMSEIEASVENAKATPAQQPENDPAVVEFTSKRILKSPVDTMQLGESLYRTKNFAAALRALQSIDIKTLSKSDVAWRDLMLALCHRRTGNTSESEAILRDLANAKGADFSGSMARWWLKQTTMTDEVRPMVQAIDEELDTLIESARRYGSE